MEVLAEIARIEAQSAGQPSRSDNQLRATAFSGSLAERIRADPRPLPSSGQRFYNTAFKMPERPRRAE